MLTPRAPRSEIRLVRPAQRLHHDILQLRVMLHEAYLIGAYDAWIFTDILAADYTTCADEGTGCIQREKFDCEAYGTSCDPVLVDGLPIGAQPNLG